MTSQCTAGCIYVFTIKINYFWWTGIVLMMWKEDWVGIKKQVKNLGLICKVVNIKGTDFTNFSEARKHLKYYN